MHLSKVSQVSPNRFACPISSNHAIEQSFLCTMHIYNVLNYVISHFRLLFN